MKKDCCDLLERNGQHRGHGQRRSRGHEGRGRRGHAADPDQVDASALSDYDAIAFGCPAMGSEVLEESEFEPMFDGCKNSIGGKRVALFGSYGWGDGEWMRSWEKSCDDANINLFTESVICCEAPR